MKRILKREHTAEFKEQAVTMVNNARSVPEVAGKRSAAACGCCAATPGICIRSPVVCRFRGCRISASPILCRLWNGADG